MKFSYVAFDAKNKVQKGITEAASLKEATKLLIDQGWYVTKIKPRGRAKVGFREFSLGRVPLVNLALFIKHLGIMIKSGISLNEALETIAGQTSSKKFIKIINQVLERVKAGRTLSSALAEHSKIFDPLMINIIRIGEESGTLEGNLEYLAGELEDRLDLRQKIKTATLYPIIILIATFGLGIVLAYFVLPKITRLFETLSFELPLTTKILLWTAKIMDLYGAYIFLGIIAFGIFFRFLITRKFMKPFWHRLLTKSPIIGSIIINYNLALVSRTIGVLLKSGLTIDQAISVASETTNNAVYKKRLKEILTQVQKGKRFSDALSSFKDSKRQPLFPLLAIKMIGVGERSGQLSESFTYLANYFAKEVDNTTKNLTTIIEPILLVSIGLIVAFVALSVISPIYQITGKFQG